MPCENPNIRVQIKDRHTGAVTYQFMNMRKFCKSEYTKISRKANGIHDEPDHHGTFYQYNLSEQEWLDNMLSSDRAQIIPCMKCEYCQKMISNKWSARVELEAKQYKEKAFLTLTYSPENLPVLNISTGEIYRAYFDEEAAKRDIEERKFRSPERGRLNPEDMTNFIKRLRNDATYHNRAEKPTEHGLGIKYFYCGEYGTQKYRPHYHMILLGYKIPDLNPTEKKADELGRITQYFGSELINKIWGKGNVAIAAVEQGSIGYVTGYCQKKGKYYATKNEKGELDFKTYDQMYKDFGLQPEYRRMSQSIGKDYVLEHAETIMENKGGELANGKRLPSINYFDKVVDEYMLAKEQGQQMQEAKDATEEEAQTTMKSDYMIKQKKRRRNNAYEVQLNERYNAYGNTGAKRPILEHICQEVKNEKLQRKNKTRQDKGVF